MYVDKTLSGIKAVQTLSRLNRAHPQKYDTMVLDFVNDTDVIQRSFEDYYRTTLLSEETDPNKLHDLKADLDDHEVYDGQQVEDFVGMYLTDAPRERLDPILDACAGTFTGELDEDGQVDFKGKAKAFVRTYGFLAAILPYTNAAWEKLSIFLNFLIPKLPAPMEEDLTRGLLETIDMDSYRVEKQATMKIVLADAGRGDRPGADLGRRPPARARARPALQHRQDLQRAVGQRPLDRRRPGQAADLRGHPGPGRGRRRLPERHAEQRHPERPDRARQGPGPGDGRRAAGRHGSLSSGSATTKRSRSG